MVTAQQLINQVIKEDKIKEQKKIKNSKKILKSIDKKIKLDIKSAKYK